MVLKKNEIFYFLFSLDMVYELCQKRRKKVYTRPGRKKEIHGLHQNPNYRHHILIDFQNPEIIQY